MRTIPTSSELLEAFRGAANAVVAGRTRPDGTPYRLAWTPTSWFNVFRAAAVRLTQRALWVVDDRFRATFLDTAEREDLDAWAASEAPEYPRKPSAAALVRLTLTRATTGAGVIPAGSRCSTIATATSPAVTFASLVDVPVDAAALTVTLDARCETAGLAGNVSAGTITRVVNSLFATFASNHTAPAAGGVDAETDDAYRNRLRQRDARARRGTPQAIELAARSVPGVERVTIANVRTDASLPPGYCRVVVGDARGIGSQPQADRVLLALEEWGAAGMLYAVLPAGAVSVLTATPSPVPALTVALRLDVTRRVSSAPWDQATAERDILIALATLCESLEHGQALHMAQVTAAVLNTNPLLRNVVVRAIDAGGAEISVVTGDWPRFRDYPAMGAANRWEWSADVTRFYWIE